jgi:hypothetical protein
MNTIHIVTAGVHEDCAIVGAYSNKTDADRVASSIDDGSVDEYPVDAFLDHLLQGRTPFAVSIARNGQYRLNRHFTDHRNWPTQMMTYTLDMKQEYALSISMWAKSEESAIKAAQTIREYLIAEQEWLTPITFNGK